jgi:hypothetical protein
MRGFRFECPKCGRKYKANKDLGGRLKRCGKCRHNFRIGAAGHAQKGPHSPAAPARIEHESELPIDEVFGALHAWQREAPGLPRSFAQDVTFGHFEPTFRVTYETTYDDRGRKGHSKASHETAELPPDLGEEAKHPAKRIADVPFEHSKEAIERLPTKPAAVRPLAEQLIKESRRPPTGEYLSRRFTVEQLRAWRAQWRFGEAEGNAWFYGSPVRLLLPNAPRRSSAPSVAAVLLTLAALAGGAWAAKELELFSPAPPPVAGPPAPAPARPKPEPVRFSRDGMLQLDDGSFRRGPLERKEEVVLVATQAVPMWSIEATHLDAPQFIRGETRRLEDLANRVQGAPTAKREVLVGLFLEVERQRDRWKGLEPLCTPSELPAPAPQRRLDSFQASIQGLLEKSLPVAVSPDPATPEVAPRPVELTPAAKLASGLLAEIPGAADPAVRNRIAGGLAALKGENLAQADLVHWAVLHLSRSEADSGLVADQVRVKTGQVDSTFEGTLEKKGEGFLTLRMASGQEVTAYREKSAWVANVPGGIRLEGAQVTAVQAAPTASGERLRTALDRLPPSRWLSATGGEHLRAAKAAAESLEKKGASANDRGLLLIRYLAAAHASAALRTGTPAEILEARTVLQGLGYTPSPEGRWERSDDRRAAWLGQMLKDSKAGEARARVPAGRAGTDFAESYRATAVQLQAPMQSREDLDRAAASLDGAVGQAFTLGESKHLLALKTAVSAFAICRSCGGGPAKICTTCRGKGTRTEACAACRGMGYITTVGIGATGSKTCEACGGKPIKGQRPCERCEGKGTLSCPKCQGVTKLPVATDIARTSVCPRCAGAGSTGDLVQFTCPTCAGLGLQLLPAGQPEATLP